MKPLYKRALVFVIIQCIMTSTIYAYSINEKDFLIKLADIYRGGAGALENETSFYKKISYTTDNMTTIRVEPDSESESLLILTEGVPVTVYKQIDDWYQVEVLGIEGFIHYEQLAEEELIEVPYVRSVGSYEVLEEVIEYAEQFVGVRYVYGGNSLQTGVDCSAFIQQVFLHFGVELNRTSRGQYLEDGEAVALEDIRPADLIYYGHNGAVSHVALYIGEGQIIHANTPNTGVVIDNIELSKPIIGAKRVF